MLSYHDLEDFMGINDALTDSRIKHRETVTAASHDRGDASDDASADEEADASEKQNGNKSRTATPVARGAATGTRTAALPTTAPARRR